MDLESIFDLCVFCEKANWDQTKLRIGISNWLLVHTPEDEIESLVDRMVLAIPHIKGRFG